MSCLSHEDELHIRAAEGWLGLGSYVEARKELAELNPAIRSCQPVLKLRWQVEAKARNWEECVELARSVIQAAPEESWGWIHNSYALHELRRTAEAYHELAGVSRNFKDEPLVFYNLACYCAQLGQLQEAEQFLDQAMRLSPDPEALRSDAKQDVDLKPLFRKPGPK